MSASQFLLTIGSTPSTPASGKAIVFVNASKNLATVNDAGVALDYVVGPAVYQAQPSDPTGTSNTTGLMMGLAGAITPAFSGRVLMIISGSITSSGTSIGNGGKTQIRYGTGTAPINTAALTGTAVGGLVTSVLESTTASTKQVFSCQAIVSALSLGTAYWVDLSLAAIVAGTASVSAISISLVEI